MRRLFSLSGRPFEFQALEAALEAVCKLLHGLTVDLENAAYPALDELTSRVREGGREHMSELVTE